MIGVIYQLGMKNRVYAIVNLYHTPFVTSVITILKTEMCNIFPDICSEKSGTRFLGDERNDYHWTT